MKKITASLIVLCTFAFLPILPATAATKTPFTCEKIKDKTTRASCIEDRDKKEKVIGKADGAQKKSLVNKSVELSGQIFVVTKGRENIKLALVGISAIPEDKLAQYIKSKHIEGLHQQEMLAPKLEAIKQEVREAEEAAEQAKKAMEATYSLCCAPGASLTYIIASSKKKTEATDIWLAADRLVSEKKSFELRNIQNKFNYFDSEKFYFEELPASVAMAKTDADGKFSLSLPIGKFVVAAATNREIFENSESYFWLVSVDTASNSHSIMLSNDNQVDTGCKECVSLK